MKDRLKEEIGYLKFWLGFFIAIAVILGSWLVSNIENYMSYKYCVAIFFIIILLFICFKIHKRIKEKIVELGRI